LRRWSGWRWRARQPLAGKPPGRARAAAETAWFSCRSASGAWIALCEGAERGLQYRFGRPGQIALAYPAAGRPDFRYAHYFRAGVDRTEVSFRNGDADYAVFDYTEGRQRSAGVRVLTASGREKTSPAGARCTAAWAPSRRCCPATPTAP
jgi:hypothetical protein